jgi:hypothetical protein
MSTETADEQVTDIPEDYKAFTAYRDGQTPAAEIEVETPAAEIEVEAQAPAAGEEATPPSEPAEPADQTAGESETAEEAQQTHADETETQGPKKPAPGEPDKGLAKRMRSLSGEIKALKSQLAELTQPDVDEEATGEVVSPSETATDAADEAVAPMLKDFEDNETTGESAWDQYEAATKLFNKLETAKAIKAALDTQRATIEEKHAKESAQADWNKAASRFPDFNEVVRAEVQISSAMEVVMRMDPETGTEIAYYLGQHPEESKRIAESTLAASEKQWGTALARAGVELGEIRAIVKAAKTAPKVVAPKAAATPPLKTVTSARKPPTIIRNGAATPKFDVTNEDDAADTGKWMKERNRQLALAGKR